MLASQLLPCCHWLCFFAFQSPVRLQCALHTWSRSGCRLACLACEAICVCPGPAARVNPTNSDKLLVVARICGCSRLHALIWPHSSYMLASLDVITSSAATIVHHALL